MKAFVKGFFYSFPIQLLLLHFKKHQVLLIFWVILFVSVGGKFMTKYGVDSLFLAPEYLGKIDFFAAAIVGISMGIFIMSWNITCFILFSRYFLFLATTSNPFLKFCINNAIIPLIFLSYYGYNAVSYAYYDELLSSREIFWLVVGFIDGFIIILLISFVYFFGAGKTIVRRLTPVINDPVLFKAQFSKSEKVRESRMIRVKYYFTATFELKKVRDVSHYSRDFLSTIFSRHHFAGVLSILIAFIFLMITGYFIDDSFFQLPAAAGVTIFFAILIAVSGAISYFLQNWSLLFLLLAFWGSNYLYEKGVIDITNKAFGLKYVAKNERPAYNEEYLSALSTDEKMASDKENMEAVLNRWKAKQGVYKPYMVIINTSGGGSRSATFTMRILQRLDSILNGSLMQRTTMISGASGGMLGAAYFRALDHAKQTGSTINLQDTQYVNDISKDLLNPIITNLVARDLASPVQQFEISGKYYSKDRAFAFENKLNENTKGLLNLQLKDLYLLEKEAKIPLLLLSSVVTQDARKMLISTQPISFLMRNKSQEVDAVDFGAMFKNLEAEDLRLLTALRMNATFPYVLPNVWLPTEPVVDIMDAGLRDNFGVESTMRYLQVFESWIKKNTKGVILIQITDRRKSGWDQPFASSGITDILMRPMMFFQSNWHKLQDYSQNDLYDAMKTLYGPQLQRIVFQYTSDEEEKAAALNFHLTKREKQDIFQSLFSVHNQKSFQTFRALTAQK
ncbi:patatin-like phospholipase family protein [Gynurincola endophyticus]|uniref:patatin-like phospholipase family protein n=1 Tax=Gynurincola endophyticus TaxID=2479004 RepID=UPI000F8C9225|nr:patatin-like phospholipase family protein [Gynurincola endophyticus]